MELTTHRQRTTGVLQSKFHATTNSVSLYYFVAGRWWSPKGETFVSTTVSFLSSAYATTQCSPDNCVPQWRHAHAMSERASRPFSDQTACNQSGGFVGTVAKWAIRCNTQSRWLWLTAKSQVFVRYLFSYFWKKHKLNLIPHENFSLFWGPWISSSFCFEALESTKISLYNRVSLWIQKYETGYRTEICDFTVSASKFLAHHTGLASATSQRSNRRNWF